MPVRVSAKFYPSLVPVCPRNSVGPTTAKSIPEMSGLVTSNPTKVKYFAFTSYSFISLLRLTPSGKFARLKKLIHNLFILLMSQTILTVTVVHSQ